MYFFVGVIFLLAYEQFPIKPSGTGDTTLQKYSQKEVTDYREIVQCINVCLYEII